MSYLFYLATTFNQNIGNWNISSLTNATQMVIDAPSFSVANYDALLIGWQAQTHNNDVPFSASSKYCLGETARSALIADGWGSAGTIQDGGLDTQTTPVFSQVPAICYGETLNALPNTSNNNITGAWSPAVDNTNTTTYTFTPDTGQCASSAQMTITVNPLPTVDTIAPQTACASYTLPALTNGNYFTATNGGGTALNAGDNITTTQTIFIFTDNGTCTNESSFLVTINPLPAVDTITPQTACASYSLPALTNGNYFTTTNGGGTALNAGDIITTTQTIFIFTDNGTSTNETDFLVTINSLPAVDTITPQTACVSYTLPALTNGNYFTASNGGGTALNAGDNITTTQTIFIFSDNGTCTNESSFLVTINTAMDFVLTNDNININNQNIIVITDILNIYQYAIDNEPFQNSPNFYNLEAGIHTVYVKNDCFQHEVYINIIVFEIPKYFTPNNDNYHDYWQVNDSSNQIKTIAIFDRFGKLIKRLNPHGLGWNGEYNNTITSGEYWYVITLTNEEQLRGHFSLKK
jgi:gliding motility-associated-like protein